jgi:hypothetical protein
MNQPASPPSSGSRIGANQDAPQAATVYISVFNTDVVDVTNIRPDSDVFAAGEHARSVDQNAAHIALISRLQRRGVEGNPLVLRK